MAVAIVVVGVAFFFRFSTGKRSAQSTPQPTNVAVDHGCVGSAGYFWCEIKQKCQRASEDTCDSRINFNQSGVLAKNRPGMAKNALFMIYEESGKTAAPLMLNFDGTSICANGAQNGLCFSINSKDYGLVNGAKIQVEGIKTDKGVTVKKIVF